MRAVSMGDGTFNTALDLIQKQPDQINGVNGFVGSNHAAGMYAVHSTLFEPCVNEVVHL